MEADALDACDAPDATATTREEDVSQLGQGACQVGVGAGKNQLVSPGVLKATSGNVAKRIRTRQETRTTARLGKTAAETAIRQIATQERQVEKEKMKAWKQMVMQEVAQELQTIRQTHEEAMETQRQNFQMELEGVNERLLQVEARARTFENERKASKAQEHTSSQRRTQNTPKAQTVPPSNTRQAEGLKTSVAARKSYAQVVASSAAKSGTENAWTEVGNRKRKDTTPTPPKLEPERRRVIFRREPTFPEKSEADLMLVLNEPLQMPEYQHISDSAE